MTDEEEYPVVTQFSGTLDYAKIAQTRDDKYGPSAMLAEPFGSRMGWFNYTDFLKNGRADSRGFTVYTPDYWKANRDAEIKRCAKKQWVRWPQSVASDEAHYRHLLGLPDTGPLLKSEIDQAFKIAAKRAHPDVGGSNDAFKQLAAAKDALIGRWQR